MQQQTQTNGKTAYPLILASSSPRRFDLLTQAGLSFTVARPDIDETPHENESADSYVLRLSREKAQAVAGTLPPGTNTLILSADTTVVDDGQIIGKPDDDAHAVAILRQLRGRTHTVFTGTTVLNTATGKALTRLTTTHVTMRAYTDEEIAAYVSSGDSIGKAGAYAIQHVAFHPMERLGGCYTNVVGLPLCTVQAMLAENGITVPQPVMCTSAHLPCRFSR